MNIVYIGSSGVLSSYPFQQLIEKGVSFSAVMVTPESRAQMQQATPEFAGIQLQQASPLNLVNKAQELGIPVIEFGNDAAGQLQAVEPQLMIVSCFARHLPGGIYQLAEQGCFNLHPSLLPEFRGPDPVYWQIKKRVKETGVTVHKVTEKFDAGEIAVQKRIAMPANTSQPELTSLLAELGAKALFELIEAVRSDQLQLQLQDESQASYFGFAR